MAFLTISICSYGIFGKNLHPDILRNFTVKALSPLVWTRLAQAGEQRLAEWRVVEGGGPGRGGQLAHAAGVRGLLRDLPAAAVCSSLQQCAVGPVGSLCVH